jgi:hypothetical protein
MQYVHKIANDGESASCDEVATGGEGGTDKLTQLKHMGTSADM